MSALEYRKIGLRLCDCLVGFMSASTKTMSWSLSPGITFVLVMFKVLFVRNKSSVLAVVVRGPPSPSPGRVLVWVRVGWSTVCDSEYVSTMSMKVSCRWRLFVWGMMGSGSVSESRGGSWGETAVQSMSGRLKSPAIQMSLSGGMSERESSNFSRMAWSEEGGR